VFRIRELKREGGYKFTGEDAQNVFAAVKDVYGLNSDSDDEESDSEDNTYKVGKNGKIKEVDEKKHYDKNGKEVDKLISEKTGKSKFVDKGVLKHVTENQNSSGVNYQYFYIPYSNSSRVRSLFNWLALNTNVEFSLLTFSRHAYISTSFSKISEAGGADLLISEVLSGHYKSFSFTHNHPSGASRPSSLGDAAVPGSSGDLGLAQFFKKEYPSISINWYIFANGKINLTPYNEKGIIKN